MKKEILRINNLNIEFSPERKLEDITICILEGEIVGFLGLTSSGKDSTVRIISGNMQEEISRHHIYIEGKRVMENAELQKKVYCITDSNYMIDDWTVAEYIGLVESSWLQMMWKKRYLKDQIGEFLNELGVEVDVSKKLKELSELEKRIVDVAKARWHHKKLLIVEDEFEGMRPETIRSFGTVVKHLTAGKMGVIVNSHSDIVLSLLSEKYVIFKKGRIVKKCRKDYIKDGVHLEKFLLGGSVITKKKSLDRHVLEENDEQELAYRISGVKMADGKIRDFSFLKGKIITFLVLDQK